MKVLCAALVPAGVHCIARAGVQQVPCGPKLLLIPMSLATCVAAGTTPSQPGHWLVIMSIMLTTHNTALIRLLCSLEMCRYNFPPVFRWAWRYLYLLSTEHKYICSNPTILFPVSPARSLFVMMPDWVLTKRSLILFCFLSKLMRQFMKKSAAKHKTSVSGIREVFRV